MWVASLSGYTLSLGVGHLASPWHPKEPVQAGDSQLINCFQGHLDQKCSLTVSRESDFCLRNGSRRHLRSLGRWLCPSLRCQVGNPQCPCRAARACISQKGAWLVHLHCFSGCSLHRVRLSSRSGLRKAGKCGCLLGHLGCAIC